MNLVFWTGCIDFHTVNVFNYLGLTHKIIIAYCERSFRGYEDIDVQNCELNRVSTDAEIDKLISRTKDFVHISNAFKVAPEFKILKTSLGKLRKERCKLISLFQEQYPNTGIKGFLRILKWMYIYHIGNGKDHKLIGYCGKKAYNSLRKALVPSKKLVEFIYTPWYQSEVPIHVTEKPTFIMVGQLVERKEILNTILSCKSIEDDFIFKIVGNGILRKQVLDLIKNDSRFRYLGSLNPKEVQLEYSESDYLILSSSFDGWGCTVNEAISQGCKAIVSDNCGAESLIREWPELGSTFRSGDWKEFSSIVKRYVQLGPISYEDKQTVISWAWKIHPQNEANYLIDVLDYTFNNGHMPCPPWRRNTI